MISEQRKKELKEEILNLHGRQGSISDAVVAIISREISLAVKEAENKHQKKMDFISDKCGRLILDIDDLKHILKRSV